MDPDNTMEIDVQDDCLYSAQHEWARKNDDGTYTVGITPFALTQLGYITTISFDIIEGDCIEAGSEIGTIESTKTMSDFYSPVTGVVEKINSGLEDDPEFVNDSPWENGWFMVISPESEEAESEGYTTRDCISPEEYRKLTAE